MASNSSSWGYFFILLFWLMSLASASGHISNSVFDLQKSRGRHLRGLFLKKCSVHFKTKDFTPLTSGCKGPEYPVKECCQALKTFACPYYKKLNDLTTDCADSMWYYVDFYGKYPRAYFFDNCAEENGLSCDGYE